MNAAMNASAWGRDRKAGLLLALLARGLADEHVILTRSETRFAHFLFRWVSSVWPGSS